MAELTLVVGSTEIDLLAGSDGYKLRLDGWTPQIAQRNPDGTYTNPVETITLRADASAAPGLSNQISADFEDTIRKLYEWRDDPVAPNHVWLRWALPGEEAYSQRQVLIKELTYNLGQSPFFPPYSNQHTALNITLSIERYPFWEAVNPLTISYSGVSSGGEAKIYNGSIIWRGSASARISRGGVTSANTFSEIWYGFRTSRYGNVGYFQPAWALDNASTNNGATKSGGIVTWTPGDTDLLERMYITLGNVVSSSAERDAQRGTFAVLLRARSTDATRTYNLRLSDGFSGGLTSSANWNTHSRVEVSGTSWVYYPLGTITIPPLSIRDTSAARSVLGDFTLRIEAEEGTTAASGDLKMERLVLIPMLEGFCHFSGTSGLGVYVEPDERINAFYLSSGTVTTPDSLDVVNYVYPSGGAYIVGAGTSTADASVTTPVATMNFSFDLYRRWHNLAGTS